MLTAVHTDVRDAVALLVAQHAHLSHVQLCYCLVSFQRLLLASCGAMAAELCTQHMLFTLLLHGLIIGTHQPWMLALLLQLLPWQWRVSVAGWVCQQRAHRCPAMS
jgi:hypothetical protein